MFEKFMRLDKLALIAALIQITNADEGLSDEEMEYMEDLFQSRGFEDFDQLLQEYENHIQSHDEYIDILMRVYRPDVQAAILQECIGVMGADREHHAAEVEVIREICTVWGKDPNDILRGRLTSDAD